VAEQNAVLGDETPPASLSEVFDRMTAMRERLGSLAQPGVEGEDEAELRSHLRLIERWQEIRARGTHGA
jgi:hypothetical protein